VQIAESPLNHWRRLSRSGLPGRFVCRSPKTSHVFRKTVGAYKEAPGVYEQLLPPKTSAIHTPPNGVELVQPPLRPAPGSCMPRHEITCLARLGFALPPLSVSYTRKGGYATKRRYDKSSLIVHNPIVQLAHSTRTYTTRSLFSVGYSLRILSLANSPILLLLSEFLIKPSRARF
jgi:hypothetical protein